MALENEIVPDTSISGEGFLQRLFPSTYNSFSNISGAFEEEDASPLDALGAIGSELGDLKAGLAQDIGNIDFEDITGSADDSSMSDESAADEDNIRESIAVILESDARLESEMMRSLLNDIENIKTTVEELRMSNNIIESLRKFHNSIGLFGNYENIARSIRDASGQFNQDMLNDFFVNTIAPSMFIKHIDTMVESIMVADQNSPIGSISEETKFEMISSLHRLKDYLAS